MQRQIAVHSHGCIAVEIDAAAVVSGSRKLLHVEHIGTLGMGVHLLVTEVDRSGVDRDVDTTGSGCAIERDRAAGAIELAAPQGNSADMGRFKTRISVVGVNGVVIWR